MEAAIYRIRIGVRLHSSWSEWFDGLTIEPQDDGSTVLVGPVTDQAALHGLLDRVRDLGIPLLSLFKVEDCDETS